MSHENNHNGFLKLMKTDAAEELVVNCHNAFLLLTIIALRARRRNGFNRHKLELGQAMVGDHKACGLTRQEYRTAMKFLEQHGFATFQPTTKGTIATIVDSRVYDINAEEDNHQKNHQATIKQPSPNHQLTTNEEGKKDKKGKKDKNDPSLREGVGQHTDFIARWSEAYKDVWGEKYLFGGGRDAKAAETLLSRSGKSPEELVATARAAWQSPEKLSRFLLDHSKTISCFANRFNEIVTALKSQANANGSANIHPMTRLKFIEEQIESHPANRNSINHDEDCGEDKRQEFRKLKETRDQLKAEIAHGQVATP